MHELRNGRSCQAPCGYADAYRTCSTVLLHSQFPHQPNRRRRLQIFSWHRSSCDRLPAPEDGMHQFPDGQVPPVPMPFHHGQSVNGFQSVAAWSLSAVEVKIIVPSLLDSVFLGKGVMEKTKRKRKKEIKDFPFPIMLEAFRWILPGAYEGTG